MSISAHSAFSVCPFRAWRLSSNCRRVGSAKARKTASMLMALICNRLVACQAAKIARHWRLDVSTGGKSALAGEPEGIGHALHADALVEADGVGHRDQADGDRWPKL